MNIPSDRPPEPAANYTVTETPGMRQMLEQADSQKKEIDAARPLRPELWPTIQRKLKIDWTYDSNAIEGSTLDRGETWFFLEHGLTVEGKPLKDFLDARNHAGAIDSLYEVISQGRPVTPGLLKEQNALLLAGVTHTLAMNELGQKVQKPATPGQFKRRSNHVLKADGSIHLYVEPLQVPGEIETLCRFVSENLERLHPAITGALAHYHFVRIHPFDDGNGRGARLLMNLLLMKRGYPPAIVRMEDRRRYLDALATADQGNLEPFVTFIIESLTATQAVVLADLRTGSPPNGQ